MNRKRLSIRALAAGLCLAAVGACGCAFPLYTIFVADADEFVEAGERGNAAGPGGWIGAPTPLDGWKPELKIGASYPGPIPRPVLEQRLRGVVRIEVRENFLRHAGRMIGGAAAPVGDASYPLPVGELLWYTLSHQMHPAPYRIVGSGFFVREGGYVATNDHVIGMPGELVVKTWDGRIYPAKRLGRDGRSDLAILKVEVADLYPVLPLGDSRELLRGDYLLALGHPFGFDLTMTQGIVAGTGRPVGLTGSDWMIQTDADINPGNSGGPLLNAAGEVVGVNNAAYLWGAKAGFAQPVDLLAAHLDTMMLGYSPEPVAAPAEVEAIDDRRRAAEGLPVWSGVRVVRAGDFEKPGTPFLHPGDIVLEADGAPIHTLTDWLHALQLKEPHQSIRLRLLRPGSGLTDGEKPTAQSPDPHPHYQEMTMDLKLLAD